MGLDPLVVTGMCEEMSGGVICCHAAEAEEDTKECARSWEEMSPHLVLPVIISEVSSVVVFCRISLVPDPNVATAIGVYLNCS